MNRFLTRTIVTLILAICMTISLQAEWSSFKLPGGVHHKTVFIDHEDVQAMASVCMSNYLCVKEWNSGTETWSDWEEVETSFISTWGLDWADIDNDAYVVVGGQEMRVLYYSGGNWVEEDMGDDFEKSEFYRVEDCVFYADDEGDLSYDQVLISLTETADDYGLKYWDDGSWEYVDTQVETEGYGWRMWRGIEDPEKVYMTGGDPMKIYSINVYDAINTDFDPAEIITSANVCTTDHNVEDVIAVPTFYQWDDDGDYYQYVVAHTKYNSVDYYDVWCREYSSGTGWDDWDNIVSDLESVSNMPEVFKGEMQDISLTACPYKSGESVKHQVYLTVENQGIFSYDTGSGVFRKVSSNTDEIIFPSQILHNN